MRTRACVFGSRHDAATVLGSFASRASTYSSSLIDNRRSVSSWCVTTATFQRLASNGTSSRADDMRSRRTCGTTADERGSSRLDDAPGRLPRFPLLMRVRTTPRAAGTAAAALAAAAVLAAAGCGGSGSSTTSATDWANGVCSSIVTWENSLKSISSSLQANPSKDGVQQAVDDAKSATDTLAGDLKKLGKPDTEAGQ